MNNGRFFIVLIPANSGAFEARRFNDLIAADQAARNNHGLLYELENEQIDIDIDDDGEITGGRLINDYSLVNRN